jgi:hypothetical protein
MLTQGEDVEAQAFRGRGWSISAIARHLGDLSGVHFWPSVTSVNVLAEPV